MGLLDSARNIVGGRLESDLRNRIQDVVRSYRYFWDPLGELLQNSVDAINRRHGVMNDPNHYLHQSLRQQFEIHTDMSYKGRILIEIWPAERKLKVSDNGVGIPRDEIERLLLPEGTNKLKGKEYGYKGKGLTYVAFASQVFKLKTKFFAQSDTHEIALDGLLDWMIDNEGTVNFPNNPIPNVTQTTEECSDEFNTEITATLADNYDMVFSAISSLNHTFDLAREEKLLKGFEVVLRSKTAVGNTQALFNRQPYVDIETILRVYHDGDQGVWERIIPYRYYHPREHEEIHTRSYSFDAYMIELTKIGFDKSFRCLYFKELDVQIGQRLPINSDIHMSAVSSTRLRYINEELGLDKEGVSEAAISYGVHLAINGMPTGIRIDDWETRGHEMKKYYALADVSSQVSDELDPGRKGISHLRATQISDKARELRLKRVQFQNAQSEKFSSYVSRYLDWGGAPEPIFTEETDFEARVQEAKNQAEKDAREEPELFGKLERVSSLIHLPASEEEVRVLFHELLAKNVLKGYRTVYSSSTRALYDSAMTYELALDQGNLFPNDQLGFSSTMARELTRSGQNLYSHNRFYRRQKMQHPELCVEYKHNLDQFLQEISRPATTSKVAGDIDVLIVWSADISATIPQDMYTLSPITGDQRIYHGTTHRLSLISPESTDIYCIVLKDVLSTV